MGKSLAHFVKGWGYCAYLLVHENKILSTIFSLTAYIWGTIMQVL